MLRLTFTELEAGRSLYMDGLLEQAALHIVRGWRTLAYLDAVEQGEQPEDLGAIALGSGSLPVGKLIAKDPRGWEESLAALEELATLSGAPGQRQPTTGGRKARNQLRQHIARQLNLLDLAYNGLLWRERTAAIPGFWLARRYGLPLMVVVAFAAVSFAIYTLHTAEDQVEQQAADGQDPPADGEPAPADGPATPPPPPTTKNLTVKLAELATVKTNGTPWNAEGNKLFSRWIKVQLPAPSSAGTVELSVDNNDVYELRFLNQDKQVGLVRLEPATEDHGLYVSQVKVPAAAQKARYDLIEVSVVMGDNFYSLGHLVLKE